MKKFLSIWIALSVTGLLLTGCGSETAGTKKEKEWKTVESIEEEEKVPDFPAKYDGYSLNVTHGKTDGEYLTVFATFTNNYKKPAYTYSSYIFKAFQDGVELEDCSDINAEQSSLLLEVQDGASCIVSYKFRLISDSDIEIMACMPTAEEELLAEMMYAVPEEE